jgi:hypothetical protein
MSNRGETAHSEQRRNCGPCNTNLSSTEIRNSWDIGAENIPWKSVRRFFLQGLGLASDDAHFPPSAVFLHCIWHDNIMVDCRWKRSCSNVFGACLQLYAFWSWPDFSIDNCWLDYWTVQLGPSADWVVKAMSHRNNCVYEPELRFVLAFSWRYQIADRIDLSSSLLPLSLVGYPSLALADPFKIRVGQYNLKIGSLLTIADPWIGPVIFNVMQ